MFLTFSLCEQGQLPATERGQVTDFNPVRLANKDHKALFLTIVTILKVYHNKPYYMTMGLLLYPTRSSICIEPISIPNQLLT